MTRLHLNMNMRELMLTLSEGNPGALSCILEMVNKNDWRSGAPAFAYILLLDTLEVYGENIYKLWNDACGKDLEQMELVLRNVQMGHLSREALHANLAQGRATPFTNLVPFEQIVGTVRSIPAI